MKKVIFSACIEMNHPSVFINAEVWMLGFPVFGVLSGTEAGSSWYFIPGSGCSLLCSQHPACKHGAKFHIIDCNR